MSRSIASLDPHTGGTFHDRKRVMRINLKFSFCVLASNVASHSATLSPQTLQQYICIDYFQ